MTAKLPEYIAINDESIPEFIRNRLRMQSEEVIFPLTDEDKGILYLLEAKHDEAVGNVTGLAAPQIGFNKRIIIFRVAMDLEVKKIFPDFHETMPRTVWINPSFEPITDELNDGYEFCLSVKDITGIVKRHTKISYEAYTTAGDRITGEASGFLARIIQHEIDHINGILFIDKIEKGSIISIKNFLQR